MIAWLDLLAVFTDLCHNADILMAWNQRVSGIGIFTFINMNITAADTASHQFNLYFIILGLRDWHFSDLIMIRFCNNYLFH